MLGGNYVLFEVFVFVARGVAAIDHAFWGRSRRGNDSPSRGVGAARRRARGVCRFVLAPEELPGIEAVALYTRT